MAGPGNCKGLKGGAGPEYWTRLGMTGFLQEKKEEMKLRRKTKKRC